MCLTVCEPGLTGVSTEVDEECTVVAEGAGFKTVYSACEPSLAFENSLATECSCEVCASSEE